MQTRDQKYADNVYKRVKNIELLAQTQGRKLATSYGSMAHKLPILIHTSGLIHALTFADTRKTEGPRLLLEDLSKTVLEASATKDDLLCQARGTSEDRVGSLQTYIYLTEQVLAALLWYKRYAQSILNVEQGEDDDNGRDGGGK